MIVYATLTSFNLHRVSVSGCVALVSAHVDNEYACVTAFQQEIQYTCLYNIKNVGTIWPVSQEETLVIVYCF